MRIRYTHLAKIVDPETDEELELSGVTGRFPAQDFSLDTYFDAALADQGVIGGEFYLRLGEGSPKLELDYWLPAKPSDELFYLIEQFTDGQLSDGAGSNGFEMEVAGRSILVYKDDFEELTFEEDGRVVPSPNRVAISAREGDLTGLVAALAADPKAHERKHQGCTALSLAMRRGHLEAVRQLLAAGADPNFVDADGDTPLISCALYNSLTDQQSRDMAQLLLNAGANPAHVSARGYTAKQYAEMAEKKLTAAIL